MRADNQRRGRHPGAARARASATCSDAARARVAHRARPLRRGAPLRRRHDHARDLGAQRGRRPRASPRPRLEPYVVPLTVRDPRRALRRPAPRHRRRRARVRPGDAGLVRRPSARSACPAIVAAPARAAARSIPRYARATSSSQHGMHGFLVLGAVVLVRHRRRGALRRHGPLRRAPDPHRRGSRSCCPRCCSTTSARARCCSRDPQARRESVLPRGAGLGAATRSSRWRRARRSSRRRR